MRPGSPFLAPAITVAVLFFLAVFVLGLVAGLTHMFWRARQERREQEREGQVSAPPGPRP